MKRVRYIHKVIKIGNFRFSFYKLGKKITFRFEYSKGWEV